MSENPSEQRDIVDTLLGYLDQFLDAVHDRVLRPIILVGRFLAYGLILLVVSVIIAAALVIGAVRFSTVYLFAHHVWITYLVLGALSTSVGLLIWRKRTPLRSRKS